MKKLVLIQVCLCIVSLSNCTHTEYIPQTDTHITLIDKTEKASVDRVTANDVTPMLSVFNGSPLSGASVEVSLITDLVHSPTFRVHIAPEDRYQSNDLTRKVAVDRFRHSIDSIFNLAKVAPSGRERSEIFKAISNALQKLSESPGTSKTLIVVSDLHENSERLKSYKPEALEEFQHNPDLIKSLVPVKKSLKGIDIYLIHQPVSLGDDKIFTIISEALKSYLESNGATVHIATSLTQ